jgi:hypothetical protein
MLEESNTTKTMMKKINMKEKIKKKMPESFIEQKKIRMMETTQRD